MSEWFHIRQIIEEHSVSSDADAYGEKLPRFKDAYEALQWLLARKCDEVGSLPQIVNGCEYHLYRQAPDTIARTPAIIVTFTYDKDEVTIIGIKAEEPEANPDE